ncbi:TPA: hypothetical protein EYP44_05660 [Candidatus Bathyarchaeota archaeon]|nr:hypothetical protein [Candidatus Bathyarchaeota archaeon]
MDFGSYWRWARGVIDEHLDKDADLLHFSNYMRYMLQGGKRIRGTFCLLVCQALGGRFEKALPYACAIEMVHAACVTPDALVPLNSGLKRIVDVAPGDVVYSLDMKARTLKKVPVKGLYFDGIKPVFKVRTKTRTIKATGNQPLLVLKREEEKYVELPKRTREIILREIKGRWPSKRKGIVDLARQVGTSYASLFRWLHGNTLARLEGVKKLFRALGVQGPIKVVKRGAHTKYRYRLVWRQVSELKRGDFIVIVKRVPDTGEPLRVPRPPTKLGLKLVNIPSYTTKEFCQVAGFILGDGHIENWSVTIYVDPKSTVGRRYIELFKRVFSIKPCINAAHGYMVSFYSKDLAYVFEKLGLRKKAIEKTIPQWVFRLPLRQRAAFIRGLLDSDGTVSRNGHVNFVFGSQELAKRLKALLDSMGLHTSNVCKRIVRNRFKRRCIPESKLYAISAYNGRKFLEVIGTENPEYAKRLSRPKLRYELRWKMVLQRRHFLDTRYFTVDKVRSISYAGEEPVYDIILEDEDHNFAANGIIIHNTLAHDDLVDRHALRRGRAPLYKVLDPRRAVLLADMLLSTAANRIASLESIDGYQTLAKAIYEVCRGVVSEPLNPIRFLKELERGRVSEKLYLTLIRLKTAALFGAACRLGAIATDADSERRALAYRYGILVGEAYQIADDLVDVLIAQRTGKITATTMIELFPMMLYFFGKGALMGIIRDVLRGTPSVESLRRIKLQELERLIRMKIEESKSMVASFPENEYKSLLEEGPEMGVRLMLQEARPGTLTLPDSAL